MSIKGKMIFLRIHHGAHRIRGRARLLPFLHGYRQLPVITLHLPGAHIAEREHERVAWAEFLYCAVWLREYQFAAQHVDELISVAGRLR